MNLNIIGMEGNDLLWRLDNLDGVCYVRDGRVETPELCDDMHVELRPSSIKEIRKQCQEWIDEKPKRDRENQEWEDRYEHYLGEDGLWAKWDKQQHEPIQHVIASVYEDPDAVAVEGKCRFVMQGDDYWGEGSANYRSNQYTDPTWGDVLREFDRAVECCRDFHHIYLEGIGQGEFEGEIIFHTGS